MIPENQVFSSSNAAPHNWPITVAMLRALDAIKAATAIIDSRGGGTETTYENLQRAREHIESEIAALLVADATEGAL